MGRGCAPLAACVTQAHVGTPQGWVFVDFVQMAPATNAIGAECGIVFSTMRDGAENGPFIARVRAMGKPSIQGRSISVRVDGCQLVPLDVGQRASNSLEKGERNPEVVVQSRRVPKLP